MRFQVHVRFTCTGWRCRSDLGETTTWEGWMDADLMGSDNIVMLRKDVPEGWSAEGYPDSDTSEPRCPHCTKHARDPFVPSPRQRREARKQEARKK